MKKSYVALAASTILMASALVTVAQPQVVAAETTDTSEVTGYFRFIATVVDENGLVLSGKSVQLFDITSGRTPIATLVTNQDGKAIFTNLPLSRNISVEVDGESQGYTVRTSEADTEKAASFISNGVGSHEPTYTKTPLTITVNDEEGEGIAHQEVSLFDRLGKLVATLKTDSDGKTVFSDKLMDGTFYDFAVNGKKMYAVTPGNDINAYLKADEIRKEATKPDITIPSMSAEKEVPKATESSSEASVSNDENQTKESKVATEASSTNGHENASVASESSMPAEKVTPSATAAKVTPRDDKKTLPSTGETASVIWNLLGIALASVVGIALSLRVKDTLKK